MRLAGFRIWRSKRPVAVAPPAQPAAVRRAEPPGPVWWPPERLAIAHRLWGEGFILPGGPEDALRLAAPLGLSATSNLLLLGCGAGGPARCIAALYGAWIAGYEADPALAGEAGAVCARAGLGQRVQIDRWDPKAPALPPRSCHHALALDPFRQGAVAPILGAISRALRPGAQISLVATVASPGFTPEEAQAAAWLRLDGRVAPVPGQDAITQALLGCRFDVQGSEDLSAAHLLQAVQAWRRLVSDLREEGIRPPPERAGPLVREAELWLRRARLIRGGRLRWVRWQASARGE